MNPETYNTPAQTSGFLKTFLCSAVVIWKEVMLKIGSSTPVRIEIELERLYVSEIYDGVQVVIPSRKAPCLNRLGNWNKK